MEHNTAKHFVLQLGSLISLYLSLSFLLVLIFGIINLAFPDAIEGYWAIESASESVRLGIAMVLVFFPTYILLTRIVNKLRRKEKNSAYLGLTKWLIYLSLLVSGLVLLGDLVAVIMTFLEGEITERFILKALAVLFVIGTAFYYYILDARGYWLKNEQKSIAFSLGAGAVVCIALAYGFTNIETPATVREMKLDEKQIQDLQSIQWQLEDYLTTSSSTLPLTLTELFGDFPVPTAPLGRDNYEYKKTDIGFDLCATFASDSFTTVDQFSARPEPAMSIKNGNDWRYEAGKYCFERVVN